MTKERKKERIGGRKKAVKVGRKRGKGEDEKVWVVSKNVSYIDF
jgi:hypothetical protein